MRLDLYTEPLKSDLPPYNPKRILAKLNEVYSQQSSDLDPLIKR